MHSNIKEGIHTVAIDDARYNKGDTQTDLVFAFCKGFFLEKVIRAKIDIDGIDGTEVIVRILTKFKEQFSVVLTHGITFGGFNVVNIQEIHDFINKPILSVTENKPTGDNMLNALKNLPDFEKKSKMITLAGDLFSFNPKIGKNKLFYHIKGISEEQAKNFLKKLSIRSRLPEQLLLAHKIASGYNFE